MVAAIAGSFIGLVLGGVLAPIAWRLVFLVSVPFGLFGTVWAYHKLQERGVRIRARIDWLGNMTFAVGLIALLVGITYGILPYGGHTMGWTAPGVIGVDRRRRASCSWCSRPSRRGSRSRCSGCRCSGSGRSSPATSPSLFSALARGGLMFMLIIWLQGIWLPQHGYSFSDTPLWAGIFMLPLSAGFLIAGPVAGRLADHFGARPFATGGMLLSGGRESCCCGAAGGASHTGSSDWSSCSSAWRWGCSPRPTRRGS